MSSLQSERTEVCRSCIGFGPNEGDNSARSAVCCGGAARVPAGGDDQRPVLCQQALAAADGMLDQLGGRQVPVQSGGRVDALVDS